MARSWGAIGTPRVRIGIRIGFALSCASSVQIHSKAAVLTFLNMYVRFSRKLKDYKLFEGPSWYKPTDVAVEPETINIGQ